MQKWAQRFVKIQNEDILKGPNRLIQYKKVGSIKFSKFYCPGIPLISVVYLHIMMP